MKRATLAVRAVWWLDNGAGGKTPVRCGWWLYGASGRRWWRPWRPRQLRRPSLRVTVVRRNPPMSAQGLRFLNDVHAAAERAQRRDNR